MFNETTWFPNEYNRSPRLRYYSLRPLFSRPFFHDISGICSPLLDAKLGIDGVGRVGVGHELGERDQVDGQSTREQDGELEEEAARGVERAHAQRAVDGEEALDAEAQREHGVEEAHRVAEIGQELAGERARVEQLQRAGAIQVEVVDEPAVRAHVELDDEEGRVAGREQHEVAVAHDARQLVPRVHEHGQREHVAEHAQHDDDQRRVHVHRVVRVQVLVELGDGRALTRVHV